MFDYEVPIVNSTMRNLTVRVFEHLNITFPMDVENRLSYTQRILRGAVIKKYREVLATCRQSAKELVGDECTLRELTGLSVEYFWTWAKTDIKGYNGHD